jgi:hypothetical protein
MFPSYMLKVPIIGTLYGIIINDLVVVKTFYRLPGPIYMSKFI